MDNNNTMEYRIGLEKQNKRNDQVTELILDNCRATQISGLTDEFVNLETLSLINVGLVTLKGFPKLPKLKKLELSDNRITIGLSLLHGSPKLQHLNLSGNRIKDFEALEPLKEFRDLVNLDLYNCEVTKVDHYRLKVFDLLPSLHSLDGYDRNEIEVADTSDESDYESSDVEIRITRDDNDLDEEDESDDDSSDYDEEEEFNGMSYEEEDNDEDEELENEDVDEDVDSHEDESFDGIQATEGLTSNEGLNSGGDASASGNEATNGEPSLGQLGTFENGDDDDVCEELGDDDEEEEEEDEDSDLKQLQRDIGDEEDSDDDDFEPDQEPDERDYEIDPEDDAEADDPLSTSNRASEAAANVPTEIDIDSSTKQRGQKRKHEDEGGDEVSSG